jgi:hypothetical protein
VQNGTAIAFTSSAGTATGTIDPATGNFLVTQNIPPGEFCPFGCRNTTTGTFHYNHTPLDYTGMGQLEVLGLGCTIWYDVTGTRTGSTTMPYLYYDPAAVWPKRRPDP